MSMYHYDWAEQKLHDACGVFGISSSEGDASDAAMDVYHALYALQHRGQQSCGIAVFMGDEVHVKKGDGLVSDVFNDRSLLRLRGHAAMGHVLYSGGDSTGSVHAQPIAVKHLGGSLAVAHNGRLVGADALRRDVELRGGIFQSGCDAELIAHLIVKEQLDNPQLEVAMAKVMANMRGAYSLVVMSGHKVMAVRDPSGYRPLCMGRTGGSVIFASESCALDAIGATFVRDIQPGEIVVAENGQVRSIQTGISARQSLCCFEFVYFARPDSVIDNVSVELARQDFGRCLAHVDTVEADVVIGVPDSGISAALGYAAASGLPFAVGLVKNRYIGRTFIQTSQGQRERAVRIKLNALAAVLKGKRVVMVDDSIVRGTTCAHLVSLVREAGAKEVHMRITSPPFLHPCLYGTDIPSRDVLAAHNRSVAQVNALIGADSLLYLPLEDIGKSLSGLTCGHCDACFTGVYTDLPDATTERMTQV